MTSKVSVSYHSSSSDDDDTENEEPLNMSDVDGGQSSSDLSDSTRERNTKKNTKQDHNSAKKDAVFDVMSRILGKHTPEKGSVILSKGATDKQIAQKRRKNEIKEGKPKNFDASSDEDSEAEMQKLSERKRQKWLWENMARVKPDVLDKEKERNLQKIATRGVVQLFNAVRKQQRIVESKLEEVGPSVRKQDRVIKTMTKGKFLDILKGTPTSNISNEPVENRVKKESADVEIKKEKTEPAWDILREDFMLGAEMKDWDRVDEDDDGTHRQSKHNTSSSDDNDSDFDT